MRIFLTGATGFVGSALLQRFVAGGVAVRALVRNELVKLPDGVEKVVGDLAGLVDCRATRSETSTLGVLAMTLNDCDACGGAGAYYAR